MSKNNDKKSSNKVNNNNENIGDTQYINDVEILSNKDNSGIDPDKVTNIEDTTKQGLKNRFIKNSRVFKVMKKYMSKAENKSKDQYYIESLEHKTDTLIDKLPKLAEKVSAPAKKIWNYIKDPNSDMVLKIAAIGVIIYLISPIDAIPDFTPVLGFVDDIAAMAVMVSMIAKSINSTTKDSKEAIQNVTKSIADGVTETLDEGVGKQSKIRIRQQLIITAISLGGAILIGIIALLLSIFL